MSHSVGLGVSYLVGSLLLMQLSKLWLLSNPVQVFWRSFSNFNYRRIKYNDTIKSLKRNPIKITTQESLIRWTRNLSEGTSSTNSKIFIKYMITLNNKRKEPNRTNAHIQNELQGPDNTIQSIMKWLRNIVWHIWCVLVCRKQKLPHHGSVHQVLAVSGTPLSVRTARTSTLCRSRCTSWRSFRWKASCLPRLHSTQHDKFLVKIGQVVFA